MSTIAKITTGLSKLTGRTGLALKAASPEILLYVGIAGSIGATVLACRATLKVESVLEKHNDQLDKIHTVHEQVQNGEIAVEEYSETDYKKDLVLTYAQTAGGFIKLYGPAVTLGVASFACIIGGHRIMKARNVAIMAAYQAVEKGFAAYRRRVVEEFGENKDYQFKHGLRSEMVTETETDPETGKTHKVKKEKLVVTDPNGVSIYAKFFDESSSEWQKDPEYNIFFLRAQQNYWNDMLKVRGHVFLNEVYEALGIPKTQAGAVCGWMIGEGRDNFIDFGIFDGERTKVRDFVNGYERSILLDFNVDGVIWDLFTKEKA